MLIYFGPVAVGGTYYVQTLEISTAALIAGLPPGLFSVGILTINNLRDIDNDRRAGKKTLAARFGRTFARTEYVSVILIALLIPAVLVFHTGRHYYALAAMLTLFPAIPALRTALRAADGPRLNNLLATTGKLLLLYSILYSVGWLL